MTLPTFTPGQQLGEWTLIERAPNIGNHQAWRMRCSCGSEKTDKVRVVAWNIADGLGTRCQSCAQKTRRVSERPSPPLGPCVGDRVAAARAARGWTQRDLSKLLRTSHTYVGKVERAECGISPQQAVRLAQLFGEPEDDWVAAVFQDQLEAIGVRLDVAVSRKDAAPRAQQGGES